MKDFFFLSGLVAAYSQATNRGWLCVAIACMFSLAVCLVVMIYWIYSDLVLLLPGMTFLIDYISGSPGFVRPLARQLRSEVIGY